MPCGCESRYLREHSEPPCPTCRAASTLLAKGRDHETKAPTYQWRCTGCGYEFWSAPA